MLKITDLRKDFGSFTVFKGLSLVLEPACYALSEPESSGKSTLLAILAGELAPSAGTAHINGVSLFANPAEAKKLFAYTPDDCLRAPQQSALEFLAAAAQEKNTTVTAECLSLAEALGLGAHLEKRFEQLSTGSRRKVYLSAAALGAPALIIADGPTNGLDNQARAALAAQFRLWAKSKVVLFASHDAAFVQACAAQEITLARAHIHKFCG